jgi:predicted O-linked N-acetylglucosamine transferase (SPINDLY family)
MSASILKAAGLSSLVTASLRDYVGLAIRLAKDASELTTLRRCLKSGLKKKELFNTNIMTGNLECAYRQIWQRYLTKFNAALQ